MGLEACNYPDRIDQPFPRLVWILNSELGTAALDVEKRLRCLACSSTKGAAQDFLQELERRIKTPDDEIIFRSLRCSRVGVARALEVAKSRPELHGLVLLTPGAPYLYRFFR
jgi:hypothetical protein